MRIALALALPLCLAAQAQYDLLLKGGRVIDAKNRIDAVRDIAISNGTVAEVAAHIDAARALKTVNVAGLVVTPGLVDIRVHVYNGTGERGSYAGDNSVPPDGFTFRNGVTTIADAGSSGWRNFEDFKDRIVDRSKTRVLAFLNIVGGGPEWKPYENAVEAGTIANIPVMIDYGANRPERPLYDLLTKVLRPGDIYTHMYSGLRGEQGPDGKPSKGMIEGRKRSIVFDLGHGGGSFLWRVAVPLIKSGFVPDSISTDLHIGSMNAGMKDMLNVMDKFLNMGMPLDEVILRSTWTPAREIKHEELGNLSVGAVADVAVLRVEEGNFGFVDTYGARMKGTRKLTCELTVRNGRVVYDLNGITREDWEGLGEYVAQGDAKWDGTLGGEVRKRK